MGCPECRAENRADAKFCKDCGAKLAVAVPSDSTQPSLPTGTHLETSRTSDEVRVDTSAGGAETTELNTRFATPVPLKDLVRDTAAVQPETSPVATLAKRLANTDRRLLSVFALAAIAIVVGVIAAVSSGNNSSSSTSAPVANTDNQRSTTPPTTTPPPTTLPTTTPQTATPSANPSVLPVGHWVVFLGSFSNPDNATNARSGFAASVPDASILHSDDYTSLLPGFWVVYVDRSFADPEATLSFCHSLGLNTDQACHGRYLSTEPGLNGHDPRFLASNGQ